MAGSPIFPMHPEDPYFEEESEPEEAPEEESEPEEAPEEESEEDPEEDPPAADGDNLGQVAHASDSDEEEPAHPDPVVDMEMDHDPAPQVRVGSGEIHDPPAPELPPMPTSYEHGSSSRPPGELTQEQRDDLLWELCRRSNYLTDRTSDHDRRMEYMERRQQDLIEDLRMMRQVVREQAGLIRELRRELDSNSYRTRAVDRRLTSVEVDVQVGASRAHGTRWIAEQTSSRLQDLVTQLAQEFPEGHPIRCPDKGKTPAPPSP